MLGMFQHFYKLSIPFYTSDQAVHFKERNILRSIYVNYFANLPSYSWYLWVFTHINFFWCIFIWFQVITMLFLIFLCMLSVLQCQRVCDAFQILLSFHLIVSFVMILSRFMYGSQFYSQAGCNFNLILFFKVCYLKYYAASKWGCHAGEWGCHSAS